MSANTDLLFPDLMNEIAFLNGDYLPIDQAKVSINDRAFLFGDGVYEVIRTYRGRIWALEPHMVRLVRSMREIQLPGPTLEQIRGHIQETYRRAGIPDAQIYVQVTRGAAPRTHAFPKETRPTLLITVRPASAPTMEERDQGVRIITTPECRWGRCDIKSVNLLPNVLAKQQAKSAGAFEAVFVRPDGLLTEGSSTNLFVVRGGRLLTREAGFHILSGITRGIVLQMAAALGIPHQEGPLRLADALSADEVFLTGTTTEILSVVAVNENQIATGKPGPVASRLYEEYQRRIAQDAH